MQYLKRTLNKIKEDVNLHDYDAVIVIGGNGNRIGKSTLGLQVSKELCPTFNEDRCVFKEEDIYKIWKQIQKGEVMDIDAAEQILLSQDTMSKPAREFVKNMISAAAKNIVYVITLSNFFKLNNFIKLEKVDLFIYVYKRGHFWVYGKDQIANLILKYNSTKSKKVFKMPPSHLEDDFEQLNDELWVKYYKKKMEHVDKGIDKRIEEMAYTEKIVYSIFDASRMLNMSEQDIMDMINLQTIKAEKNEFGQYKIPNSEILRIKDEMKQKVKEARRRLPKDIWRTDNYEYNEQRID